MDLFYRNTGLWNILFLTIVIGFWVWISFTVWMYVCVFLSLLCFVQIKKLRWTNTPPDETCQHLESIWIYRKNLCDLVILFWKVSNGVYCHLVDRCIFETLLPPRNEAVSFRSSQTWNGRRETFLVIVFVFLGGAIMCMDLYICRFRSELHFCQIC